MKKQAEWESELTDPGHVVPNLCHSPKNNWGKSENLQNSITLHPLGAVWRAGYLDLLTGGVLFENRVFGTVRRNREHPTSHQRAQGTGQARVVVPVTY